MTICIHKRTLPAPLDTKSKKANTGPSTFKASTSSFCNIEEDLALSSSSSEGSIDEMAHTIENNIL
jgi:hypothetical protein